MIDSCFGSELPIISRSASVWRCREKSSLLLLLLISWLLLVVVALNSSSVSPPYRELESSGMRRLRLEYQ